MKERLGQKLLDRQVIDEAQLRSALERQRLQGGRLGHNLLALGYLSEEELTGLFSPHPPAPRSVEDTGLELTFLADLALKHVYHLGEFRLADLAATLRLPTAVVDPVVAELRREKLLEVRGASEFSRASFRFIVTDLGKIRAGELFEICRYTGPAPVDLESYRTMVELQTVRQIEVEEESVRRAFRELIVSERLLQRLGPAISSGMPMFLYGPPGNGKTTIAETIGQLLPDLVYLPYALYVGGQVITIFDPISHVPAEDEPPPPETDLRWVRARRPVVIAGGELTLRSLDLDFNTISKFYEASLQLKANNGLFLVDDFGRQQVDPKALLNRWIVNLDRRIDYLALHTGMKFEVPFDQLVIFATNLEPKNLVDEAFLRRIRYKIKIGNPDRQAFEKIFRKICTSNRIPFDQGVFDYLVSHYYQRLDLPFNACHPRDIIDHIIDDAHYYHRAPRLTREEIDMAWESYFVEN